MRLLVVLFLFLKLLVVCTIDVRRLNTYLEYFGTNYCKLLVLFPFAYLVLDRTISFLTITHLNLIEHCTIKTFSIPLILKYDTNCIFVASQL